VIYLLATLCLIFTDPIDCDFNRVLQALLGPQSVHICLVAVNINDNNLHLVVVQYDQT
jgi:hypothetical protein